MVETGRLAPCLEPSLLTFRAKSHGVATASRERGSCARVAGALVQEEAGSYVWSSTSLCRLAYDGQRDGSRKRAHGRGGDRALPGTSRTLARTWGFCQERQRLELVLIRPQGRGESTAVWFAWGLWCQRLFASQPPAQSQCEALTAPPGGRGSPSQRRTTLAPPRGVLLSAMCLTPRSP